MQGEAKSGHQQPDREPDRSVEGDHLREHGPTVVDTFAISRVTSPRHGSSYGQIELTELSRVRYLSGAIRSDLS